MLTGFARLNGRTASGSSRNQPTHMGGLIFPDSSDKAARFIWICNAYNIPILFLVDIAGYMIGSAVERQGIIRHGAKMIFAVSECAGPAHHRAACARPTAAATWPCRVPR